MKITKFFLIAAISVLMACGDSKFPGFDKTESGLYYTITEGEESGDQVQLDDIITIDLKYSSDDTLLYDSKNVPYPTQLKVGAPAYQGDVMEGFIMMKVGDEGIFKTSADSFFSVIAKIDRPEFIDSGSYLTFEVKVLESQTIEELTAAKQAEASENQVKEEALIASFIAENNVSVQPKESGLYFIETAPGDGKPVERGSMVKVHYIGRLLTGEKFDASYDRGEPIEFTLGSGQVIPGWDEGIGYMTVGSKATLIIPSRLAYSDNPPPGSIIKAYSPLVFDVELVGVN
jgi:FKBP-type peptidyl-prolyl cis-trans isomerase FkpA